MSRALALKARDVGQRPRERSFANAAPKKSGLMTRVVAAARIEFRSHEASRYEIDTDQLPSRGHNVRLTMRRPVVINSIAESKVWRPCSHFGSYCGSLEL